MEERSDDEKRLLRAFNLTLGEQGHLIMMVAELHGGREKFGRYNSTHEGLGVIYEEWIEFRRDIMRNDDRKAVEEAIQLAAVALRFAMEFGGNDGD